MAKAEAKYTIRAEDRTQRGLRSAENRLQRFGRVALAALATTVGAIGAGFVAWGRSIETSARRLNRLGDEAKNLNATLEEAQAIAAGAEIIGVPPEEVRDAVETLAERIIEAKEGSGEAFENFQRLGIEAAKLERLGVLAQLVAVAEAFQRLPAGQALGVQSALFGEGRGRLFQSDLRSAFAEAGRLNLLEGLPELVEGAREYREATARLSLVTDRLTDRLAQSDLVIGAINALADTIAGNRGIGRDIRNLGGESGEFTLGGARVEAQLRPQTRILQQIERNTRDGGATFR